MPEQSNKCIAFPQSSLPVLARQAVATYRAKFDDSTEDARRLEGIDLTEKLVKEFSARTVASWVRSLAALHGEAL